MNAKNNCICCGEVCISSYLLNICQAVFSLGLNNIVNGFVLHCGNPFYAQPVRSHIIRGEKKGESEGESAVHLWFTSSSLRWVTDEESDWVFSKDRLRLLRQMTFTPQPPSSALHRGEIEETVQRVLQTILQGFLVFPCRQRKQRCFP